MHVGVKSALSALAAFALVACRTEGDARPAEDRRAPIRAARLPSRVLVADDAPAALRAIHAMLSRLPAQQVRLDDGSADVKASANTRPVSLAWTRESDGTLRVAARWGDASVDGLRDAPDLLMYGLRWEFVAAGIAFTESDCVTGVSVPEAESAESAIVAAANAVCVDRGLTLQQLNVYQDFDAFFALDGRGTKQWALTLTFRDNRSVDIRVECTTPAVDEQECERLLNDVLSRAFQRDVVPIQQ